MSGSSNRPDDTLGFELDIFDTLLKAQTEIGEAFVVADDGRLIFVNEAFCRMTGYSPEELANVPAIQRLVVPEDREVIEERYRRRLAGEDVESHYESAILHKSGRRIEVEVAVAAFETAGGKQRVTAIVRDITDRKRMEASLYESEEKFRTLAETMMAAVVIYQEDRLLYVNPAAETLTGFPRDELLAMDPMLLVHPDSRPAARARREARLRGEPLPSRFEVKILTRAGEARWVEVSGAPVQFGDRRVLVGSAFDVTERKQREELLRNVAEGFSAKTGAAFFQSIVTYLARAIDVDYALVGGLTSDADESVTTTTLYANGRIVDNVTCDLPGSPCENVVGKRLCCYPSGVQALFPADRVLADMQIEGYAGTPLFDSQGRALGLLVVMSRTPLRDPATAAMLLQIFAARTAAELERSRAEAALRQSEERYRSLFQDAPYGMYRSTLDARFLDVNPALVRMLGYTSPEELLAADITNDIYVDPDERRRAIERAGDHASCEGDEHWWKRRDGTTILVRLSGRPVRDARGKPVAFEMIVEDVTERRALEEHARQALHMEAVGRLAGGIAHDFNNLLTVIGGYGDLLLGTLDPEDARRGDVEQIRAAARRAADLTRQLLAFGRKQMRDVRVLDLNALVSNMDSVLERVVREDIELRVLPSERPLQVEADASQVEEIVVNLAANARDAMPEGGRLTIALAEVQVGAPPEPADVGLAPGRHVCLSVADTGAGMDEATRARIFEPFFTTKEMGRGTGLGLSTVYGIVIQSGGRIRVDSEPGRGTTFRIYLPRVDAPSVAAEPIDTAVISNLTGTETILLVEDEAPVRSLVRLMLQRRGYTVIEASNGEEALELAARHGAPIHLLLTDVVMPELDGPSLAERLQPARPEMAVLFMSGYMEQPALVGDPSGRRPPFLYKPFTADALARKVREALGAERH